MRFYKSCVTVVERIQEQLNLEEQLTLMETPYEELWRYSDLGVWIENHYLKETDYLYKAFKLIGKQTKEEMTLFLLEFSQGYLVLERAEML